MMKPITTPEGVIRIRQYFEDELRAKDTEIQRLKGLIEEAYLEGEANAYAHNAWYYDGTSHQSPNFIEFKQKHGL